MLDRKAEARAAIDAALAAHPTLCDSGFGISNFKPLLPMPEKLEVLAMWRRFNDNCVDEVATAIAYLRAKCQKAKTVYRGSYGLKHAAEDWGGDNGQSSYVSNGEFIIAALWLGYDVLPLGDQDLRWLGCVGPNAKVFLKPLK